MIEQQLTHSDLPVSSSEIYEMMGYGNQTVPEPEIEAETQKLLKQISAIARPSFLFFSINGQLDTMKETLTVEHITFHLGKIITRQLRKSESFVFFVATAGYDFERFQQTLRQENDPLKNYIADTIGSVIAEKTADCMELALEKYIASQEWKHTNRFSPGYCGWHVSEQHLLFSLFPSPHPCGIHLSDSSLMIPIKSVSGIIGTGSAVHKVDYTCGLCTYDACYRRKKK